MVTKFCAAAFSPDDTLLAVFTQPLHLELIHWKSERTLWRQKLYGNDPTHPRREMAFAPNGQWIAVMTDVRCVQLLEAWTGEKIMQFDGHLRPITALAFSPGARHLGTSSEDTNRAALVNVAPALPLPERWQDDDHLWRELAGSTAAAYRVIGPLIAHPERALQVLAKRLEPVPSADAMEIRKDLKDLGSAVFAQRQAAMQRLRALRQRVLPFLQEALKNPGPLEVKRRLEEIVKDIDPRPSADELRTLRAILVLEMIGTPEAIPLLRRLAKGDPGADATRHARAAVARLEARGMNH